MIREVTTSGGGTGTVSTAQAPFFHTLQQARSPANNPPSASASTASASGDVIAILATIAALGIAIWILSKAFGRGSTGAEHLLGLAGIALVIIWANKSQFLAQMANAGTFLTQSFSNTITKG